MWKINLRKNYSNRFVEFNAMSFQGLPSLTLRSLNTEHTATLRYAQIAKATSHVCKPLSEIRLGNLSIDLKGWTQL